MSGERRYTESEVQEILTRATDRRPGLPGGDPGREQGLTLSELQEIGTEVGIPAGALAEAAASLDRTEGIERTLGLPLTVSRTVPLPRNLTDMEWERLVADLRETFRARGKVREHGNLREWSNGNLHALVEPTGDGWRLRMGTTKGNARAYMTAGGAMLALVAVLTVLWLLGVSTVSTEELVTVAAILGTGGVAGVAVGALQLPSWARRRQDQMAGIAERVEASLERLPPATGDEPGPRG